MKHSLNSLVGFTIGATDGEIGKVKEFYFDDETWTIRYLIIETGNWLMDREVLISPHSLLQPDWKRRIFPVNLTKQQVKNSPDIDTQKPVSIRQEIGLQNYYVDLGNWGGGFYAGGMTLPMRGPLPNDEADASAQITAEHSHLRSSSKVTGYNIKAADGEIGKVEDFLLHSSAWKIDFMVVDTGHWLSGKKVLISPKWIKEISWGNSQVTVKASMMQVKHSPEYDPAQPISKDYEVHLHNYYGEFVTHIE